MTGGYRWGLGFLVLLSIAHGLIDLTGGTVVALLPTLREQFSLSYAMVGTILLSSSLTSSLTQPIFGLLSDRSERRWLLPVSLVLSGAGLAAVGWMPGYGWVLVAVVLSALGTASFHPEGAHAAHNLSFGRRARAMAIYSVGGNLGFALGPLYASLLIFLGGGIQGTAYGLVLALAAALLFFRLLPRWQAVEAESEGSHAVRREDLPAAQWAGTILLTLLTIVRSVINNGIVAYIPFYWIDVLGHSQLTAGYVQATYTIAGVFGTLLGAPLADRIGTRRMLLLSFGLLLPLQAALPFLSGWLLLVVLFLSGFTVVSTFTVTLVMTQEYMPRNPGLASGLNLGLAFGMGGVGTTLLGMVADRWGVVSALHTVTFLVPAAMLLAFVLPAARPLPGAGAARPAVAEKEA